MNGSSQKGEGKKKVTEVKTFPVPFALGEVKENISTNTPSKLFKEEIINQAIKLHIKGNIPEASKYYQYCINEGFNDHRVFSNYGVILQSLGKLQEAELSMRKAIEIKPDYAKAYSNLEIILGDLGKLEELILLSKSTLESKSIDNGNKLRTSIRIAIANLIKKDFSSFLLSIKKINEYIKQGSIDIIKNKKSKKYILSYLTFINSLYPLLEKDNNNSNSEKIPHIGESHCLSFAHQTLSISSEVKKIQPVHIAGGKAWHFASRGNNQWKESLKQQIKNHTYCRQVLISFGEIDCREDEGIMSYSIKANKSISETCENTVQGYLDFMEKSLTKYYSKRYYFGIPAPTKRKELVDELDIKRVKIIKQFNSCLKKEVLARKCYFLDVLNLTSTEEGFNNNIHMCDDKHLSPKCLHLLFENHLYEP